MDKPIDRRAALTCLGWLGAGTLFTLTGGVASVASANDPGARHRRSVGNALSFVQISDTHVGFSKPANPDPVATFRETVARIRAMPRAPDFILHTGDVTHLAEPAQFDLAAQLIADLPAPLLLIPGEHDMVGGSDPRAFLQAFGRNTQGDGWFYTDVKGVRVIGLVNVVQLDAQGQGTLGRAQLDWLSKSLEGLPSSTPIILLSHFPLWGLYPQWGWGTADAAEAFSYLARFGSVTALNGHIHQIQRKLEGRVQFHAARSTAYPQPAPGNGPGPGPLVLPGEQLRSAIGYSSLEVKLVDSPLEITDVALA